MRMFIFTNKIHSQVQIYVHIKLHINLPMKLLMKYKILCELKFMKWREFKHEKSKMKDKLTWF